MTGEKHSVTNGIFLVKNGHQNLLYGESKNCFKNLDLAIRFLSKIFYQKTNHVYFNPNFFIVLIMV